MEGPAQHALDALHEPTARAVAERLLRGAAEVTTAPDNPSGGCLIVQGALVAGGQGAVAREELAARRRAGEDRLRERFERAEAEGELPAGTDAGDLARYIAMVSYGISVQAAGGAGREELHRVVDIALNAWPRHATGAPAP
ncbi:hypothetical protein ABT112_33185 [Streptomyces sp. NPDC002055]|uniref:TetR family transcriptional regulator C-terminal domain-containing protein n=1 Tax=Streptomyces sp. NPDC002055 TaxID=3154534 RepID=UPI00332943B2